MLRNIFGIILVAFGQQAKIISPSVEPKPALSWNLAFQASCPGTSVQISGFGASRAPGRLATIMINGHLARGSEAAAFAHDLSNPRAVYRLGALCARGRDWMQIRINAGAKNNAGIVEYSAGTLEISDGTLSYRPLVSSDAESFWFR